MDRQLGDFMRKKLKISLFYQLYEALCRIDLNCAIGRVDDWKSFDGKNLLGIFAVGLARGTDPGYLLASPADDRFRK